MKRFALEHFSQWLRSPRRKPMILRGARQVGKTWIVRELARTSGRRLVELNFERDPAPGEWFKQTDPAEIMRLVSARFGVSADPDRSILFLDEIQAAPWVVPCLRWFFESMPELPVIAAGSLLEFVLDDHDFSMPVGRVTYFRLEPMTFLEFAEAAGFSILADEIRKGFRLGTMDAELHRKATELFRDFCLVGGMPEAVATHVSGEGLEAVQTVQADILASYRDDFNKYRARVPVGALEAVFRSVPAQLGGRFMFSRADPGAKSATLSAAFRKLEQARVVSSVRCTPATGLPLGAGARDNIFKAVFLDVGLVQSFLGLGPLDYENQARVMWAGRGALAEQAVGQLLRYASSRNVDESLFFWRQVGSGNAEIDYLVQRGASIVPVEVKAGASGAMKSLHYFMFKRQLGSAVRIDANPPSFQRVKTHTTQSDAVEYDLWSYPFYMTELLSSSV